MPGRKRKSPESGFDHDAPERTSVMTVMGRQYAWRTLRNYGDMSVFMYASNKDMVDVFKVKCSVCGHAMKSLDTARKHWQKHSKLAFPCTYETCSYSTTSPHLLKAHKLIHSKKSWQPCDWCGVKIFTSNLRRHQRCNCSERLLHQQRHIVATSPETETDDADDTEDNSAETDNADSAEDDSAETDCLILMRVAEPIVLPSAALNENVFMSPSQQLRNLCFAQDFETQVSWHAEDRQFADRQFADRQFADRPLSLQDTLQEDVVDL